MLLGSWPRVLMSQWPFFYDPATFGVLMLACWGIFGPQPPKCGSPNQQAPRWVLPSVNPTDDPPAAQVLSWLPLVYLLVRFCVVGVAIRSIPLSHSAAVPSLIPASSLPGIQLFTVSSDSQELPPQGKSLALMMQVSRWSDAVSFSLLRSEFPCSSVTSAAAITLGLFRAWGRLSEANLVPPFFTFPPDTTGKLL